MAEIVLQNPWALSIVLPLAWLLLIIYSWRRRFKPFSAFLLRLAIIVLLALALSQPIQVPATVAAEIEALGGRLIVLVDQSESLGVAGQQTLRGEAARLIEGHDDSFVLFFADQPVLVDDPLAVVSAASGNNSSLDPTISNLADALTFGKQLLNNQPGRLVLLSDGLPTTGDTLKVAAQLGQENTPVDVLIPSANDIQIWHGHANDVQLVDVSVPLVLRQGETFDVEVIAHSQVPVDVTLNLKHPTGSGVLAEEIVGLEPGFNHFSFNVVANEIGPQTFRATIAADEDGWPENNSFSAFAQVYPTPRVLIVTDETGEGRAAGSLLQEAGFEIEMMRPAELPDRLSELESYDGMVLLNVSANSLELEQMIAIQEFVRSLGRGLVVNGGRDSFDLGHYEDTPLAELIPVSLEPPPREERPPVALLLIVDHSGSMVEERGPIATRLTMAKEAAIRATDFLGPKDLIGVLMFDNKFEWVVPFQEVSEGVNLLEIQQNIARIAGGGGTRILKALETALPALIEQETAAGRLAVLLTDGKSFDREKTIEDYDFIVDEAVNANITLSTIAIGTGADIELAQYLAERGRGRYHFAEFPEELPALTVSESDILRTNALQEGDFGVAAENPHPIIRGLISPGSASNQNQVPNVKGYLAMTPKPSSEVALQIGQDDPLLSVWGYGLGRVVAWSSDTGKEWTSAWQNWSELAKFWGQVVGYTLPAPNLGLLQLDTVVEADGTVVLAAEGVTATGQPVDFSSTQALLTTPGGQETPIQLRQVAPGRYERRVRLSDPGAYQVVVNQTRTDGPDEIAVTGFVLPYPEEYALPATGSGSALLMEIASVTGGRTFALGELPQSDVSNAESDNILTEPVELWPWFLLAALILWPVEIAMRRWGRLRIQ